MTSKKKILANRQNLETSMGPDNTDNTRLDATKHWILSGWGVIEKINGKNTRELFEELNSDMWQAMDSIGFVEEKLVYQLVELTWRRRRLRNWEAKLVRMHVEDVKVRWENPIKIDSLQSLWQNEIAPKPWT